LEDLEFLLLVDEDGVYVGKVGGTLISSRIQPPKKKILVHGELIDDSNNDNFTSCLQFSQQAKFTK